MVVETRSDSISVTTREQRNQAIKEYIKNLLEEIWDFEPDETFCKTFSREAKKSIHRVLHKCRT